MVASRWQRDAVRAVQPVFPEQREAARVHVLDGRDVDTARIPAAPRR